MKYRDNYGKDTLSILGFGCMRFPKKGNGFDVDEIEREIIYAVEHGVNYFDTAYIYPGSEEILGKIIDKNNLRDRINIATKMPHYLMKNAEDADKHFEEQLTRLKTDHVDYYLMHMLPDVKTWDELCKRGIDKWLEEKKKSGAIRHIGFSYHGNSDKFIKLLSVYEWDFCQIQYNYMDEYSQAGKAGLMEAAKREMPVIIMEPLRGGRLVNALPKAAERIMQDDPNKWSYAEWALKWLWNQKEVSVVLSGMNSLDMVKENIRIASETAPGCLTERESEVYEKIKREINAKIKVPCTGCAYCMPCPAGVDIPGAFRCYNVSYTDSYATAVREYMMCTTMKKEPSLASQCVGCGRCEKLCPQGIEIRKELKCVKKRMETPIFTIIRKFLPGT